MGKIIVIALLIIIGIWAYNIKTYKSISSKKNIVSTTPTAAISPERVDIKNKSIFVSYWADMDNLQLKEYERVIYFGVQPALNGINTSDAGYANLGAFVAGVGDKKKWLTLRLVSRANAFVSREP
jgi:hypothetical protein